MIADQADEQIVKQTTVQCRLTLELLSQTIDYILLFKQSKLQAVLSRPVTVRYIDCEADLLS